MWTAAKFSLVLSITVFIVYSFQLQPCAGYEIQELSGKWTAHSDSIEEFEVDVPGGIYTDLMKYNIIPDIFSGYNDVESRWVARTQWIYERIFDVGSSLLDHNHQTLIFEGIDTFASIYLNGKLIAKADNMFVRYELIVDGLLKTKDNELSVFFESPITKSNELYTLQTQNYTVPPKCVPENYNGECHVNHVRKMQASFAWDWGPAFPSVGLWKTVYIKAYNATYIKDLNYEVVADGEYYKFLLTAYAAPNGAKQLNGRLTVNIKTNHDTETIFLPSADYRLINREFVFKTEFKLKKFKFDLWWPNGYGQQALYPMTITFESSAGEAVSKSIKVGIREVELVQEPIENGLSFYFKINNLPIFAKGSNMVPSHILPEHSNNITLIRKLMQSAKDVHMNMIRVWGGGLYESDYLYELADEMGIMIWQDFMFACSMYPVNSEFLSIVEDEVQHQVRRLQHHPSIVLWAGNNENEAALVGNWYGTMINRTQYNADYRQLYGKTIRNAVLKNDPSRKYLSSSPTNGAKSEEDDYISSNPGSNQYGDVHFYNYVFDSWDINVYPTPRFASEYGYQALPSYNSMIKNAFNASDLFVDSKFMSHRQHHPFGNGEMQYLMAMRLKVPQKKNVENFNKAYFFYTQIIQAMAVKIETEHYRQWQSYLDSAGHGMTMGALYWQLNCPWLAPTWSGLESTGKWMMLHYFAKDFFAPIIVTYHKYTNQTVDVYIVSDEQRPIFNATLKISVFNWNSLLPVQDRVRFVDIRMGSNRLTTIMNIKRFLSRSEACDNYKDCFIRLSLFSSTFSIAPDNYIYPVPLKDANIPFANVQIKQVNAILNKKYLITVVTDYPAGFVWLESTLDGIFSENGFTMLQQRKEIVFITEQHIGLHELLNSLQITHLRNKDYFG